MRKKVTHNESDTKKIKDESSKDENQTKMKSKGRLYSLLPIISFIEPEY